VRFRQHGEGRPAFRGVGPFTKSLDQLVSLIDPVEHLGVAFFRDLHTSRDYQPRLDGNLPMPSNADVCGP